MINFVFLGPPGSGKSTQATYLEKTFGFIHAATGKLLRSMLQNKTEVVNEELAKLINAGQLAPDEVVEGLIEELINKKMPSANGFIFDGFPRTAHQARVLDSMLESKGASINAAIELKVPQEELLHRISSRASNEGRQDDSNLHIIEQRINLYNQNAAELIAYYQAQNKYVCLNGMDSQELITKQIFELSTKNKA